MMRMNRRHIVAALAALSLPTAAWGKANKKRKVATLYGLIGKMTAKPGQRAALAAILVEGISEMPGCLSYIVANDPANADLLWITEVWESQAAHVASLSLPSVKEAITKGRPLIAGMESVAETSPVGGQGLKAAK